MPPAKRRGRGAAARGKKSRGGAPAKVTRATLRQKQIKEETETADEPTADESGEDGAAQVRPAEAVGAQDESEAADSQNMSVGEDELGSDVGTDDARMLEAESAGDANAEDDDILIATESETLDESVNEADILFATESESHDESVNEADLTGVEDSESNVHPQDQGRGDDNTDDQDGVGVKSTAKISAEVNEVSLDWPAGEDDGQEAAVESTMDESEAMVEGEEGMVDIDDFVVIDEDNGENTGQAENDADMERSKTVVVRETRRGRRSQVRFRKIREYKDEVDEKGNQIWQVRVYPVNMATIRQLRDSWNDLCYMAICVDFRWTSGQFAGGQVTNRLLESGMFQFLVTEPKLKVLMRQIMKFEFPERQLRFEIRRIVLDKDWQQYDADFFDTLLGEVAYRKKTATEKKQEKAQSKKGTSDEASNAEKGTTEIVTESTTKATNSETTEVTMDTKTIEVTTPLPTDTATGTDGDAVKVKSQVGVQMEAEEIESADAEPQKLSDDGATTATEKRQEKAQSKKGTSDEASNAEKGTTEIVTKSTTKATNSETTEVTTDTKMTEVTTPLTTDTATGTDGDAVKVKSQVGVNMEAEETESADAEPQKLSDDSATTATKKKQEKAQSKKGTSDEASNAEKGMTEIVTESTTKATNSETTEVTMDTKTTEVTTPLPTDTATGTDGAAMKVESQVGVQMEVEETESADAEPQKLSDDSATTVNQEPVSEDQKTSTGTEPCSTSGAQMDSKNRQSTIKKELNLSQDTSAESNGVGEKGEKTDGNSSVMTDTEKKAQTEQDPNGASAEQSETDAETGSDSKQADVAAGKGEESTKAPSEAGKPSDGGEAVKPADTEDAEMSEEYSADGNPIEKEDPVSFRVHLNTLSKGLKQFRESRKGKEAAESPKDSSEDCQLVLKNLPQGVCDKTLAAIFPFARFIEQTKGEDGVCKAVFETASRSETVTYLDSYYTIFVNYEPVKIFGLFEESESYKQSKSKDESRKRDRSRSHSRPTSSKDSPPRKKANTGWRRESGRSSQGSQDSFTARRPQAGEKRKVARDRSGEAKTTARTGDIRSARVPPPQPYPCDLCNVSYSKQSKLNRHKQQYHGIGIQEVEVVIVSDDDSAPSAPKMARSATGAKTVRASATSSGRIAVISGAPAHSSRVKPLPSGPPVPLSSLPVRPAPGLPSAYASMQPAVSGTCRNCGQRGHYARDCKKPSRMSGNRPMMGGAGKPNIICRNCMQDGHVAKNCPLPQQQRDMVRQAEDGARQLEELYARVVETQRNLSFLQQQAQMGIPASRPGNMMGNMPGNLGGNMAGSSYGMGGGFSGGPQGTSYGMGSQMGMNMGMPFGNVPQLQGQNWHRDT